MLTFSLISQINAVEIGVEMGRQTDDFRERSSGKGEGNCGGGLSMDSGHEGIMPGRKKDHKWKRQKLCP